jgi:hypothetical protein
MGRLEHKLAFAEQYMPDNSSQYVVPQAHDVAFTFVGSVLMNQPLVCEQTEFSLQVTLSADTCDPVLQS